MAHSAEGGTRWRCWKPPRPDGRFLGLDADATAIARVAQRLAPFDARARLVQANFREMAAVAADEGFGAFQAVLLDLGVSSFQLAEAERGFSFLNEGPLDMRMDQRPILTAEEIVNDVAGGEIWRIPSSAMERSRCHGATPGPSSRPARSVRRPRWQQLIARVTPGRHRIHPATRTFQALRIAVNDELGAIEAALPQMRGAACPQWPDGGHRVSFAGRPHRETFLAARSAGLHLSTQPAGMPVRTPGATADHHAQADSAQRSRDRRQPTQPQRQAADCRATVAHLPKEGAMLNRTTVSTPLLRVRWRGMRDAVLVGPQAMLFQVVGLVLVICLLMCAYLWQSNAISDIVDDSQRDAEQELAAGTRERRSDAAAGPDRASRGRERQARRQGMEPAPAVFVIQMPAAPGATPGRRCAAGRFRRALARGHRAVVDAGRAAWRAFWAR